MNSVVGGASEVVVAVVVGVDDESGLGVGLWVG